MKILIVSQYFYPENFRVNDIAFDLAKKGHVVTVLTGKPNYPKGRFHDGYNFLNKGEEIINGVHIIRTPIFPRLDGSAKFLILNYLSFCFFSLFSILFRIKGDFDVIFSHLPSPLTSALPGIWLKKKFKVPLVMWVLDLWPESVSANSSIKKGFLYERIKGLVQYIYNNSDKILVSSNSFKTSIIENFSINCKKVDFFPNWAEDVFLESKPTEETPCFPDGFNIVFAGNIGEAQNFENILKAVELTKGKGINWIIIGEGRKLKWVKKEATHKELDNLFLLGRYPIERMPGFFNKADAMLVALKNEPTFSLTIPAKIQAYMASSKIIVAMLNGEGNELIKKSRAGVSVRAGDYVSLANEVVRLQGISKEEREMMEKKSKEYYDRYFNKKKLFLQLQEVLNYSES